MSGTGSTFFTTLAGFPIATKNSGMSLVTMLPDPMVHPFPIVTPGMMVTFPPIQQSSPIVTWPAYSTPSRRDWTPVSCVAAKMETNGPNLMFVSGTWIWQYFEHESVAGFVQRQETALT